MRSLRWKILLTSLALVLIPIFFLNRYAIRFFDLFTRTALENNLTHYAFLVGEQYRSLSPAGGEQAGSAASGSFSTALRRYGKETGARIRIVSTNAVVLYDSAGAGEIGRDLASRPEIAEALAGGYSARSRLTRDRSFMVYYCARPIKDEAGNVVGVAYVLRHTGSIMRAIQKLIENQRLATWLALLVALVTAALLSQTLTVRLRRLTRRAREYAEGSAPLDVHTRGGDEIAELGRTLSQMATEIERRNLYNRDFVSTTLHELRAPLTAIKGSAEILEQSGGEEQARHKFVSNIRHQTERMIRMVAELGELTRLDVESLRCQKDIVDYPAFVAKTAARLAPAFDQARAEFRTLIPDESLRVRIVRGRVEQVLANLLENAFRYTPVDGMVTLAVTRGEGDTVVTSVSDTGCGIPGANLGKVFDRFFTTDPKDGRPDRGSGLGLAIARSIVENHRGSIRVESREGQGACFSFALPLVRS